MFELANRLIGIYKTHDITKCLTYIPEKNEILDNNHNKKSNEEEKSKEKII